jgi:site-specific DNA recombinase
MAAARQEQQGKEKPTMTLTTTKHKPDTAPADAVKRAVLYLRVSSRGQLETDYDDDGLSIAAQRERCVQKAAEYGAVVVDEYIERAESAKTNQRPELNVMLRRIKEQRDIDYVILWKVDRFARNRRDDANMLFEIELAGARLISATENIDQTPAGRLMHGMLASFAEYYSRNLANEVLKGMTEKAKRGGTPGRTRLGYLNIREQLPQGGEVRTISVDPERGPIITWAFETYATGLYSLSDMVILLEARGLRSRGSRRYSPQPLSLNGVHNLLSCPYYAGIVSYNGKQYPGRHEPLVSQDLFDQVQAVLAAHRLSGERDRKHQHYLKGTIRCGTCGCRLVYSRNKGNGGIYEYFVCPRNQRGECPQGYQPVDLVENAVEDHYATVSLTETERDEVRQAISNDLGERVATAKQEIDRCRGVLREIREQERKLLTMHYEDRITSELFDDEQARLRLRRQDAEALIARLNLSYGDIAVTLDYALGIVGDDLHELYLRVDDSIRRLINQALFNALFVCDEAITDAELAGPFAELRDLRDAIHGVLRATPNPMPASVLANTMPPNARAPVPWREREPLDVGSISEVLVELGGLEPPTSWVRSRRSPN